MQAFVEETNVTLPTASRGVLWTPGSMRTCVSTARWCEYAGWCHGWSGGRRFAEHGENDDTIAARFYH